MIFYPPAAVSLMRRIVSDPKPHAVKRIKALAESGSATHAALLADQPPPPPAPPAPSNDQMLDPETMAAVDALGRGEQDLLLTAMIAAAKADGGVDPEERRRIARRMEADGVAAADRAHVLAELDQPLDRQAVLAQLGDPTRDIALRSEIYLTSLLAIRLDDPGEIAWMRSLANALALPDAEVRRVHALLAEPCPWLERGPAAG